ncbi:MAG TPA: hypothetical protein VKJ01_15655, partial [Candidatus Solibacter sp.]|nr:hypothetical protein [Candidatus Solibacter sp.]
TAIVLHVDDSLGHAVPNVAVRVLQENPADTASVSCASGPGADPGSVLTDASGTGTCQLVFGTKAGTGTFHVTVGGTAANFFDSTTFPPAFLEFFVIPFITTAPAAGSLSVSSGGGQSGVPGQTLANPLVVRVADSTGTTPISGAAVTWTVSPAGAATVNPSSSSSNAQGLASTTVTLSNSASGQVTVGAIAGNITATFTINVVIPVTVISLQKLSGDSQTAISGSNFAQPLVVQVNSSAGTVGNFPVAFTVSGPASIGGQTSATVNTDGSGKAQVTLTAGATTGSVTVTANAQGKIATFLETAIPIGPTLSANSFFNAAGLAGGSMSPCSLVTITGAGVAPGVQGSVDPVSLFGGLPLTLGPDSVTFNNLFAPILRVSNVVSTGAVQESVTVQVPCEVSPGSSVPVTVNAAGGTATVNVPVQIASPGIFETPMSDGVRRGVMVRPDGSFVSLENPARRGEVIRVYVTGLGATAPPVGTNAIAVPGTDSLVLGQVIVGVNNSGARVISSRMAPTQIGIYEVEFQVDSNAPTGNNVVLSVAINPTDGSATQFSNGSKIPIQ